MSEDPNTTGAALDDSEAQRLGRLAHSMNNAIAYVVTNLNLLAGELERLDLGDADRIRILQMVDTATAGATQVHLDIRRLKVLSWVGDPDDVEAVNDASDDTWNEGPTDARILIVDDETQILRAITRALKTYDLTTAEHGRQALDILAKGEDFDLILCDLVMRDVSGIDVYRWLMDNRPQLLDRLIFVTAGTFTDELRNFLASVPNPILNKPFDTKTLRWMVAQRVHRP